MRHTCGILLPSFLSLVLDWLFALERALNRLDSYCCCRPQRIRIAAFLFFLSFLFSARARATQNLRPKEPGSRTAKKLIESAGLAAADGKRVGNEARPPNWAARRVPLSVFAFGPYGLIYATSVITFPEGQTILPPASFFCTVALLVVLLDGGGEFGAGVGHQGQVARLEAKLQRRLRLDKPHLGVKSKG